MKQILVEVRYVEYILFMNVSRLSVAMFRKRL